MRDIIALKKSKFTESQIVFALQQAETVVAVAEVCRKLGVSDATFGDKRIELCRRRNQTSRV